MRRWKRSVFEWAGRHREALEELTEPDIVLVPGGEGNRPLLKDETVLGWLRGVNESTKWTTSVCTGSLVLAAAGLLDGRRATSHWLYREQLRELGADPVGGRFVEDGKFVTAAGVSARIGMALHLVGQEADYFPGMLALKRSSGASSRDLVERLPGATNSHVPVPRDCTDHFFAALWARPELLFKEEIVRPMWMWQSEALERSGAGASGPGRA